MVPADSDRVSRARPYSGTCPGRLRFRLRDCYPLWCDFPFASTNAQLCNFPTRRQTDQDRPYNPVRQRLPPITSLRFGLIPFARHYSGSRGFFPFLGLLRCFSSPACHCLPYGFRQEHARITTRRFPHSDIPGSKIGQHLPRAYRSRPRPSSALGAKASTVCPFLLIRKEHVFCRYGVFKVRAGRRPSRQVAPESRGRPGGRSLKTQQRVYSEHRGRRCSRRARTRTASARPVDHRTECHNGRYLPE